MTSIKNKLTTLRTVYPPISAADAYRLKDDPEVEELLRKSDFYMIGGRAQARLTEPSFDHDTNSLTFNFVVGEGIPTPVTIRLQDLPGVKSLKGKDFIVELDEAGTGFKVWDGLVNADGSRIIEWFTTEKLLWDLARERPGIDPIAGARDLATYDLLYVGIAKTGDSFDRLIKNGHTARMNILSNEKQRYPGARPSDEVYLFLFEADPLIMQTFDLDHEFTEKDFDGSYDAKRIVADAEKAFVNLLKPHYNKQRFRAYPRGKDGLYGEDYLRYGYVIGEEMAFNTAHGTVRGGLGPMGMISNDADAIFVEGETVTLHRAGIDFPDESGAFALASDEDESA